MLLVRSMSRWPLQDLLDHPHVSEIKSIPTAFVPLIAIENFRGVKIDLLFAPLPRSTIPKVCVLCMQVACADIRFAAIHRNSISM